MALATALGAAMGCLLSLDNSIACGDGYVDELAGEKCDLQAPQSEWSCGAPNISGCDPTTCQCTICGDGNIDPGEQCDGSNVGDALCLNGSPLIRCDNCVLDDSQCPTCGNGRLDPGEECDYLASGDFQVPIDCSDIASPFGELRPFASGQTTRCTTECRYDRTNCGFCGNGEVNPSYLFEGFITLDEVCDGEASDPDHLLDFCRLTCAGTTLTPLTYDCRFECADDCRSMIAADDPQCCLPKGEFCPSDDGDDVCCWSLVPENAASGEHQCADIFNQSGQAVSVCR